MKPFAATVAWMALISAGPCPAEEVRFGFWDEAQLAKRPAAGREAIIAWQAKGFGAGAHAFPDGLGETAPGEGDGSHIARERFHCPEVLNDGKQLLFFKDTSRLQTLDCCRINLTDADGAWAGFVWFSFAPSAMQAEAAMGNHFGICSSKDPIRLARSFVLERTGPGDLVLWQKSKKRMAADGTFLREGCTCVFFIRGERTDGYRTQGRNRSRHFRARGHLGRGAFGGAGATRGTEGNKKNHLLQRNRTQLPDILTLAVSRLCPFPVRNPSNRRVE